MKTDRAADAQPPGVPTFDDLAAQHGGLVNAYVALIEGRLSFQAELLFEPAALLAAAVVRIEQSRRATRHTCEPLDLASLPWDTTTASGKYFVELVRRIKRIEESVFIGETMR